MHTWVLMQAQRRSFHTSPANERSCPAFRTQSRHSVYQRTVRFTSREDKHLDGLTLLPWQGGRCLAWDATVVDTLAPSYVAISAQVTSSAAQAAAERKVSKYAGLPASHLFVPIVIETLGPINEAEHSFLSEPGRRLSTILDDPRESFFLFQRISILIQRFNAVAFRVTFDVETGHDE